MSSNSEGEYHYFADKTAEQDLISEYKIVEYNYLFGGHSRLHDFPIIIVYDKGQQKDTSPILPLRCGQRQFTLYTTKKPYMNSEGEYHYFADKTAEQDLISEYKINTMSVGSSTFSK